MSFHEFDVHEIYSNASGTVQFIELALPGTPSDDERFLAGHTLTVTSTQVHQFTFLTNLPDRPGANATVLLATQGFANLGIVTPDYIIPDGFLFLNGGTINFADVDIVTYAALPTDGTHSVNDNGTVLTASPRNFAGVTGSIPAAINVVNGNDSANLLTGLATDDEFHGFGGNDTMDGVGGGDDTFDGGSGIDMAVVHFASTGVQGASIDGSGHLHVVSNIGELTFIEVERIRLDDALVAFDTQVGGSLWQADALLWAGLGFAPDTALLSQWVHVADTSASMASLGQLMLDTYVPGLPTEALVRHLFNTVLDTAPTDNDVNFVVGLVGHGQMFETNGDLLAFVASLPVNTDQMAGFTGSTFQLLDPSFF